MNSNQSARISFLGVLFLAVLASACNRDDDKAVKGRTGPNGAGRDSVSDLALNEEGLGAIQIGMTLAATSLFSQPIISTRLPSRSL